MDEFLCWLRYYMAIGEASAHAEPPLAWALSRLAANQATYGVYSPEGAR